MPCYEDLPAELRHIILMHALSAFPTEPGFFTALKTLMKVSHGVRNSLDAVLQYKIKELEKGVKGNNQGCNGVSVLDEAKAAYLLSSTGEFSVTRFELAEFALTDDSQKFLVTEDGRPLEHFLRYLDRSEKAKAKKKLKKARRMLSEFRAGISVRSLRKPA